MPTRTLFAYALGSDLEGTADLLEARFDALVAGRTWESKDVWVVNQRFPAADAKGSDDAAPEWDLGLNLALPPPSAKGRRWFDDVAAIARALGALSKETGRRFVIGVHDAKSDRTSDVFVVDREEPDLDALEQAFERAGFLAARER